MVSPLFSYVKRLWSGPPNRFNFPSGLGPITSSNATKEPLASGRGTEPGVQMDSHCVSVLADWDLLQ
jgi:hypothetical protein